MRIYLMDRVAQCGFIWLAELHGANLWSAKLHGADFRLAELHGADLSGWPSCTIRIYLMPGLHGADLSEAELHGADLSNAKLHGANFQLAKLHGADLSETELHGADLGQAILKNTDLSDVRWDKPEDWDNIIISIRDSLKEQGLADDEINKRVSRIERISSTEFGFIPPNRPSENNCVFHSGQGPFTGWPEPGKGCYLKLASSLADLACRNQSTAKSIVNRAIYRKKDINLVTALLNKDCSFLKPYRKALNDRYKKFNQQRISE